MGPGRILFAVFMAVPLIEIAVFILVGNAIGLWPTLLGVLVTAIIGSIVLRVQGMAVFNEIRQRMNRGEVPARALADAALIGTGGLMLLLPGYFSDLIGILLLLPPVRSLLYRFVLSRVTVTSVARYSGGPFTGSPATPPRHPGTIDLDGDDWRRR